MASPERLSAFLAYIPVVGWLYVLFFKRGDRLAAFHLRQSVGLALFLAAVFLGWAVVTWALSWIPFAFIVGIALFAMVITAGLFGIIAMIMGMAAALNGRMVLLPLFGRMANRLPF